MCHVVNKIFLLFKKPFLPDDNKKGIRKEDYGNKKNNGKEKYNLKLAP
jgi:hypothetical protein